MLQITMSQYAAAAAKSLQPCPTLCDPIDGSPPGSPIPGILQPRTLGGLPFPSPMHESEKWKWVAQSCLTLSDPMDCSLPGSSVHGIFQARVLEWSAIAFSDVPIYFMLLHTFYLYLLKRKNYGHCFQSVLIWGLAEDSLLNRNVSVFKRKNVMR